MAAALGFPAIVIVAGLALGLVIEVSTSDEASCERRIADIDESRNYPLTNGLCALDDRRSEVDEIADCS